MAIGPQLAYGREGGRPIGPQMAYGRAYGINKLLPEGNSTNQPKNPQDRPSNQPDNQLLRRARQEQNGIF